MGAEILILWFLWGLVLGPGVILAGIIIIVRRKARLSRNTDLNGSVAILAGIATVLAGAAMSRIFWEIAGYFPH